MTRKGNYCISAGKGKGFTFHYSGMISMQITRYKAWTYMLITFAPLLMLHLTASNKTDGEDTPEVLPKIRAMIRHNFESLIIPLTPFLLPPNAAIVPATCVPVSSSVFV